MNVVAQNNPLDQIVANANAARLQPGTIRVIFTNELGKLAIIADRRCRLRLQIFPDRMPIAHPVPFTLALYDMQSQTWQLKADQAAAEEWMVEARTFFGVEEPAQVEAPTTEPDTLPTPQHPAEAAAEQLLAERPDASPDFRKRLTRAVQMVKAETYDPTRYNTSDTGATYYPNWQCSCPDAQHRNLRDARLGQICKHTLTLEIINRIRQQAETIADRRLRDNIDRNRRTAHETAQEPTEKPWYLRPDPLNRSRAAAGNAQFRPSYGTN